MRSPAGERIGGAHAHFPAAGIRIYTQTKKHPLSNKQVLLYLSYIVYLFFHVPGAKRMMIGIISSLPKSMTSDRRTVEKFENPVKLPVGPTTLKPGPTLLIQASVAVIFVSKSKPSTDTAMTVNMIMTT